MARALGVLMVLVAAMAIAVRPWTAASPAAASPAEPAPIVTANTVAGLAPAQAIQASPSALPQAASEPPVIHEPNTPAFHDVTPRAALPKTLNPSQFSDPRVRAVYTLAAQIEPVLYQQPCYCHCDQEIGHHCLLDCFTGDHASICDVCMMEAVYAYRQTKAGQTPGQIRVAIKRGDWKSVNLNDLVTTPR